MEKKLIKDSSGITDYYEGVTEAGDPNLAMALTSEVDLLSLSHTH
jgi:hypothetical protein